MKRLVLSTCVFFGLGSCMVFAQTPEAEGGKHSYYEQRAREDAEYEQNLALNEEEAEDFWEDQQHYEKELKKRDKKAYKAYMKGKRDAYAEHYEDCGHHCGHGHHYYSHATFYYHGYYDYRPYQRSYHSGVRVGAPRIRVGIL